MSDRTCPECGETKPVEQFWGVNRRREEVCTPCRRRTARKARYLRNKSKKRRDEFRRLTEMAMKANISLMDKSQVGEAIAEINVVLARIEYKLKKYAEKVAFGMASKRTEHAITHQTQRLNYYEEIKELLMEAAGKGFDRPLEYYLSNTYLLHKHGFPCVVVDADPRLEMETEHGDND
jgi:hypothetical protein